VGFVVGGDISTNGQQEAPGNDQPVRAQSVDKAPNYGRKGVHPDDMQRDHGADDLELMAPG
ncbi:uncharacterized protein METZ01_LOCUS320558, partial [marine metagenome]